MTRQRRSATEARRRILEAAEKQLTERGADGIRIQGIADQLGIVPATVLHHFGSREALLGELMLYGARKLEARLEAVVAAARPNLERLSGDLFDLYESRGYAALYASLPGGRRPDSAKSPAFAPLLERLQERRNLKTKKLREQTAHAVMALNLIAFGDALVGGLMRSSVGLADDDASRARFRRFVGRLMDEAMGGE